MPRRGRDAAVDNAICCYLEALAATIPPSPLGIQLEHLRNRPKDGPRRPGVEACVVGVTGQPGLQCRRDPLDTWHRAAKLGGPLRYVVRDELVILAARYWARSFTVGLEAMKVGKGKVVKTIKRRSALLAYKAAAKEVGMTENAYRKRLSAIRAKVRRALDEDARRAA